MAKLTLDDAETREYLEFKKELMCVEELVDKDQFLIRFMIGLLSFIFGVVLTLGFLKLIGMW